MKNLIMGLAMVTSSTAFAGQKIECKAKTEIQNCHEVYNYLSLNFENKKVERHELRYVQLPKTYCVTFSDSYKPKEDVDFMFSYAKGVYLLGTYKVGDEKKASNFNPYAELSFDFPTATLIFLNKEVGPHEFTCKFT